MIIEESTSLSGAVSVVWQQPSGVVCRFKFTKPYTEQDVAALADAKEDRESQDHIQPIFQDSSLRERLVNLVSLIRERPTVNMTQFNAYLGTLPWYEEAKTRALIFDIGSKLAERKEFSLANMTEAQFLQKVRDFILNTPVRKLAKLFINEYSI